MIRSDDGYNNEDNEEDNDEDNDDGDGETAFLRTRVMKTMGMTMRTMRMRTGSCNGKDDNVVTTQQLWSYSEDDAKRVTDIYVGKQVLKHRIQMQSWLLLIWKQPLQKSRELNS